MIKDEKKLLRKELLHKRQSLNAEDKAFLDNQIIENIIFTDHYKIADLVIMYAATKGEIDLTPLFNKAISDRKKVAFPRCFEGRQMKFFLVSDIGQLEIGKYGIQEPKITLPEAVFSKNDLCIVPAIAYDREGYRLGYGGGYYDVFLSDFIGKSVGAVYDFLLVEKLPREETDHKVEILITEKGSCDTK